MGKKTNKAPEPPATPTPDKNVKATKAAAEPPKGGKNIGEIAKERGARRRHLAQQDVFVFVQKSEKPLAPQAQVIVNTIEAAGENGLKRGELIEALKPVLTTRQPPERILAYYQAHLVDAKLIRIVNPERETPAAGG